MDRQEWAFLIVNNPGIVNLSDRLSQIITEIGQAEIACELPSGSSTRSAFSQHQRTLQSRYAVVLEAEQVIGVVTPLEVVGWLSTQVFSEDCEMSSIFTRSALRVPESDLIAQIAAIHLLQQHKVSCLPIVDARNQFVGLLTTESVARFSQPLAPLRLQTVADVMQTTPILVGSDCSIGAIAQQMAKQNASVVVLPSEENTLIANRGRQPDWGIIQAQDIVQLLALGVDLNRVQAATILQPISTIAPDETLWSAYQQIDRQGGYPLAVISSQGQLVGLLSLDDLLRAFDPLVLYQLSEACAVRLDASKSLVPTLQAGQTNQPLVSGATPIFEPVSYASLMAASPVGILRTDIEGICTYVNDRYCEILGLEQTALIGQPWSAGYRTEDLERIVAEYEKARRENRPWSIEYHFQRPDGSEVWVYGQLVIEYNAEGQEIGFIGTLTDISDRKRTEFLLESQHKVLERIAKAEPLPDILNALLQTTEFHLPGTFCSILLCKAGHLHCIAAPSLPSDYCDAVDGAPIGEGIGSCGTAAFRREVVIVSDIATDPLWQDYQHLALAHNLRACWSAPIISSESTVLGVFGVYYQEQRVPLFQDLERLRQSANIAGIAIERSQATQSLHQLNQELECLVEERTATLRASEERWQLAVMGSNDAIWDWDLENNKKFYSSLWKELRGFSEDEIGELPAECLSRIHPEDYESVMVALHAHFAGETKLFAAEYRSQCKDGSYIWISTRGTALRDHAGKAIRIIGSETDITQRKHAELALQESEKLYATLAAVAPVAICRFDAPMNCVYVSDRWSEMTGRPVESALGQGWIEAIHPEDRDRLLALWNDSATPPDLAPLVAMQGLEGRHLRPDGSVTWVYIQARPEFDDQGQICGCISTLTDITQRKQIEAELAASEAKFRRLVEGVQDVIWALDRQWRFTYLSPQFQSLSGWEAHEWLDRPFIEAVYPEDRELVVAHHANQANQSAETDLEFRMRHRDQPYVWVRISSAPVLDVAGEWVGYQGTLTDITDRKRIEAELAASEAKYRQLVEGGQDLIWAIDAQDRFTYLSPQFKALFGWEPSEWIGQPSLDAVYPDDRDWLIAQRSLPSIYSEDSYLEFRHRHRERPYVWVRVSTTPLFNTAGQCIGCQGILADVTDRKNAELALQASERRYASLAAAAPVAIFRFDSQLNCSYVNDRWSEMTGRPAESALGQGWLKALHPEDREVFRAKSSELVWDASPDPQFLQVSEGRHLRPDGTINWFYSRVVQEIDEAGNLVGYVGTLTDITDRKAAEKSLNLTQFAMDKAALGYFWIREDGLFLEVNESACTGLGYTYEELKGRYVWEINPELQPHEWPSYWQALKQNSFLRFEVNHQHKDGRIFPVEIISNYLEYEGQGFAFAQVQDISDRKAAELALQESERRYASLAAAAPVAIFRFDRQPLNCVYVNERWSEMTGRPAESALGRGWLEALHPEDREQAIAKWSRFYADNLLPGDSVTLPPAEGRHLRPDGTVNWFYVQVAREFDESGNVVGYVGTLTDITERKTAELALQESQAQFHRLTENVPGAIIRYVLHPDDTDEITYASSQIREVFEIEPETALQDITQVWARIHPEDISWLGNEIRRTAAESQQPIIISYRLFLPQKGLRWVQDMAYVERLDNGDVVWDGIIFDISDRKQVELALEQEILRRTTIFNTSSDGIHILDCETNLLEANASFFQMLGYTPEEARHFNVGDWDAQLTREDVQANLQNFPWDTSRLRKVETLHRRKDGSIFPVEIYICRMEWDGQPSFICISRDISERKQAEAQLQQTNEELLRATRLKDEFLANMSHELRTPLNAILGMSEALQDQMFGLLSERQLKMVRTVEQSGEHLLTLINDILDVAKIESGQITLEYTPVDIALLCQSSFAFINQQAFKKGIQLNIQLPTSPLPNLYLDDRRIRQVFINLLNNAVKFTQEGGRITLKVTAPWELQDTNDVLSSAHPMLQLSVTDTGIGIAPENIPKLFQPFVQIDGALNRQYAGTGLGLALVKRIVELHGGEVHLTSELGVGSCFTISLPYHPLETVDQTQSTTLVDETSMSANTAEDSEIKILLAEDNEDNITIVVDYLEVMGYSVFVAHNGQEAIELTQSLQPDLVLMDIQMPIMDGLEAIGRIRQIPEFSNLPIIALTALAMPGDELRCLDSGATDYLSKPVRLKNLHAKIQSLLHLH